MKQAAYPKRSRNRPFERRTPKNTHRVSASDERQRATYQQAMDKYLNLAREASSSGDPVSAESYYQYADHYYRLVAAHRPERSVETVPASSKETPTEPSSPFQEEVSPEPTPLSQP